MSGYSTKDFFIILTKSKAKRASKVNDGTFARFVIHPHIDCDFFEFGCKIYERGSGRLRLGIETASKTEKAPPIEGIVQICWQDKSLKLNSGIRGYWLENNVQKSFQAIDYSRLKSGDVGTMIVNRKMNTIHIRKNNEPEYLLFETLGKLPESLDIYFCIEKGADMGLVHYHEFIPHLDKEEYKKEEKERIENIVSDPSLFSNLRVKISEKKELQLWKSFFSHTLLSKHIDFKKSESMFKDCSDLSLNNISEEIVLEILLGRNGEDLEISMVYLVDYYLLFRGLGLKREMKVIIEAVRSIDSLGQCCDIFSKIAQRCEGEVVQSWFRDHKSSRKITVETFSSSLALQLFIHMKELLKKGEFSDDEIKKKSGLVGLVHDFKGELNPNSHPDFENINLSEEYNNDEECEKLMKKLRNGSLSNVTLICSDGKRIPAHREILAAKTNFFGRMLHFDGVEQDELREKGTIHLENIDSVTCSLILDHVYLGKMEQENETEKLEVIIRILVFAHMYSETTLLNDALERLSIICLPGNINNMSDLILQEDVGCMLYGNDNLNKFVVPILRRSDPKVSEVREIYDLIQQSFDRKKMEDRGVELNKKVDRLESKIDEMVSIMGQEKEERETLNKKIDSLCALVQRLIEERGKE